MTVFVVNDAAQIASTTAAKLFFSQVDRAVAMAGGDEGTTESIRVAFGCEGVNLGRPGSIELVSLAIRMPGRSIGKDVFVVDVGNSGDSVLRGERIAALKKLFECRGVQKIIHDCRVDCDALYHLCDGVRVYNVHDTSCFHAVITGGTEAVSLNKVLRINGLRENAARDSSIYERNPRFWATRPLTAQMIGWAASGVDKLIKLADKQTACLLTNEKRIALARSKSKYFAKQLIEMKIKRNLRCKVDIDAFLGKQGCNLQSLQRRTGTVIRCVHGRANGRSSNVFVVYYKTQTGLEAVKRQMGYYTYSGKPPLTCA